MIRTSLRMLTRARSPWAWTPWTAASVAVLLLGATTLRAQQVVDTTVKHSAASDSANAVAHTSDSTAVSASPAASTSAPDSTRSVAAAPDATIARQPTDSSKTHTVKKGDTLWDLAAFYLNNPFLWPQIYQLNTAVVRNPHWIYPGQRLRLPNGQTIVVGEKAKPDSAAPATVAVADSTAPKEVAETPDSLLVPHDTATAGPYRGTTVFSQAPDDGLDGNPRFGGEMERNERTSVRAGEFYAAPWVSPVGGPSDTGRLVAIADIPGIAPAHDRTRLTVGDRAYMTPPRDAIPMKGDRYMTITLGPELPSGGQVVTPTGIVEVERVSDGDAVTVRVVEQFRPLEIGNGVIPVEPLVLARGVRPAPLALGPEAKVIYIPSGDVLPSIQQYVVLDATLEDGVKVGDQFTLYRPRVRTDRGVMLPEEPIALAQVVRVTDRGVTAIIVDQRQPAIKEGTHARLTARMP